MSRTFAFYQSFRHRLALFVGLLLLSMVLLIAYRESDFVARSGGEEFVLVLPATQADGAYRLAEKIRALIEASPPSFLDALTISIGVATVSGEDTDPSALVDRADQALYQAKRSGRNKVVQAE